MASALLDTLRRRRAVSGEPLRRTRPTLTPGQRLAAAALAAGPARDPDEQVRTHADLGTGPAGRF